MVIQPAHNRAVDLTPAAARADVTRPVTTGRDAPTDRVVVSEQARQLSARLAGAEGPELQLSPERLRELIEQVEEAHTPGR